MPNFRINVIIDPNPAVRGGKKVEDGLDRIGRRARNLRTLLQAAFPIATITGFAFALTGSIRTLANFEQAMSTVRGILGATDDQFQALSDRARELGTTTRFTATDAAEGLLFLARAGFDANQSLETIGGTLLLAQSGALELGRAADIATNVLTGFRLETGEINRVVDVLAKGANSANTSVGQLGEAIKFVGPVAAGTNVSLEESTAAIQALSNAGLQASLAGTGLRRVIAELESPGNNLEKVLRSVGLSAEDVRVSQVGLTTALQRLRDAGVDTGLALEIFGQRGGPAFEVLSNAIPDIIRSTEELQNAEGTAKRIAEVMDDNLNGALLAVKSALEGLQLAFGELGASTFLTVLFRGLATVIRFTADNLDILVAAVQGLLIALAFNNIGRGLELFTRGLVLARRAVIGLTLAILANPLGALAVAVTTGAALLNKFKDDLRLSSDSAATLGDVMGVLSDRMSDFGDTIANKVGSALDSLGKKFPDVFGDITFSIEGAIRATARFGDFINAISTALPRLLAGASLEDVQRQISDAIRGEGVLGREADVIIAEAERRAAARVGASAGPAGALTPGVETPAALGPGAVDTAASDELNRRRAAFEELTAFLDPLVGLQQDFTRDLLVLDEALASGIITQDVYNQAQGRLIDGFQEARLSIEEVTDALTGSEAVFGGLTEAVENFSSDIDSVFDAVSSVGETALNSLTDQINNFVEGGKFSFRDFADSVLAELQRIAIQQAIVNALGGFGSGGEGGTGLLGAIGGVFGGARQAGGPVQANRAFLVGESGPELFVPRTSGQVVPNEGSGRTVVQQTFNIQTPDADSFRRSQPQIQKAANRSLRRAEERR